MTPRGSQICATGDARCRSLGERHRVRTLGGRAADLCWPRCRDAAPPRLRRRPPALATLTYDTPDATSLAHQVAGSLADTTPLHVWREHGLDHGANISLMAMWPAADVPVVQLSMPRQEPQALLDLGRRPRSLRSEGVIVIGSKFMTHGRGGWRDPDRMPQIEAFDAWAADAATRGDVDALLDFRRKAPGARRAHPTSDHFVPLLLTLAAADDPPRPRRRSTGSR